MDWFINGKMTSPQQARISAADAGFGHAVGLFETMAAQHGQVFRLAEHLDRLIQSAKVLGLASDLGRDALAAAVEQTITHNRIDQARLRLTVTAGEISLLHGGKPKAPQPTVVVTAQEPTVYDPDYFQAGITVLIAPAGANPFDALAGHKTLGYWARLRTLRQAAAVGAGEAIWLNVSNHIASGAISNVFLVKDGQLLTPFARGEEVGGALPAPVLPGITRAVVIELAGQLDLPVERRMLSVADMLDADEMFLTNSSWQVLPVTKVEKKSIGAGDVGAITQNIRTAILELIEKDTGSGPDQQRQ